MAGMRLLVHNALIIPVSDAGPSWFAGWFLVGDDGRIAALGEGEPDASLVAQQDGGGLRLLDVGGALVAPGFVSAHSHLFTSGMRGISPGSTLYPWVMSMVEVLDKCEPDDVYWSTLHGALDFLANGVTSAYNFMHPRVTWRYDPVTASPVLGRIAPVEFATRQMDGAADAGLRVMNAIRLNDEAGPEDEVVGVFGDMVAESALRTPADQHLGASVMGAVQWASAPRSAELEVAMMREHGISNQAHFVETAEGIETQREKFAWYDDGRARSGPTSCSGTSCTRPTRWSHRVAVDGVRGRVAGDVERAARVRVRRRGAVPEGRDPGRDGARRPVVHRHLRPLGQHADRPLHDPRDVHRRLRDDARRRPSAAHARVRRGARRRRPDRVARGRQDGGLPRRRPPRARHRAGLGRARHVRPGVRAAEPQAGVRRRGAGQRGGAVDVAAGRRRAPASCGRG